jgi:hypothetical protein
LVEIQVVIIKDGDAANNGGIDGFNMKVYVYDGLGFFSPTSGYISAADFPDPPGRDISNVQFCGTVTAVNLISFDAQAGAAGVALNWETGTEVDNAGFNLYRGVSANGPWTKVNETLVVAKGDPVSGASYSFVDTPGYGTFYYQLEDVDYYGVGTLHGPAKATVASPFRRPLHRPTLPGY